tara:strand:+ start:980 stop:1189 length:210 start_codon:yes stop_codon:yes gene_type:complete
MDRLTEMLAGGIALIGGFWGKRILSRQDRLEERIDALERVVVSKESLRDALEPLERSTDMILTHILNKK